MYHWLWMPRTPGLTIVLAWPGLWVQVLTQLLTDIVADPISKQMTMVDILNEPDSRGLRCPTWMQPFCYHRMCQHLDSL